jgi:hypothetical protein
LAIGFLAAFGAAFIALAAAFCFGTGRAFAATFALGAGFLATALALTGGRFATAFGFGAALAAFTLGRTGLALATGRVAFGAGLAAVRVAPLDADAVARPPRPCWRALLFNRLASGFAAFGLALAVELTFRITRSF